MSIRIVILSFFATILIACNSQFKHPDTSNINTDIHLKPFYRDFFDKSDSSIEAKHQRLFNIYGDFFNDICQFELGLGKPSDSLFNQNLQQFIDIRENAEVIASCDSVYNQLSNIDNQLSDAFACLKFYFPDTYTPNVYCHFSGFNRKIIVDSTFISFSIEHYLGADCRYYPWLEIPQYARFTKERNYIVPDIVKAWLYANFPDLSNKDDILSAMIYQGKILFAVKSCLPSLSDRMLFGFDEEHLKWCRNAESEMWACLAEQKLLYSTNPLDRNKLINDAPFTSFFGPSSPGRAVLFCGFNIVCNYMKNNPDTSLQQLLDNHNPQQILIQARYQP